MTEEKIGTFDMITKITEAAEKMGVYDAHDDIEIEFQEIIKKAKEFNKKVEKVYSYYKKEGFL